MTPIAPHIEAYLHETLAGHRGASQHTCDSYAYSFQLLFEFAAARHKVTPSSLMLEQIDAQLVSAFLEYLEDTRGNAPETRNVRACHQLSQTTAATSWTAARKFRAVFSYRVAIARNCLILAKKFSIRWRAT